MIALHEELNAFDLKVYAECDYEIVANELIFLEKPGMAAHTWRNWAMRMKQEMGWVLVVKGKKSLNRTSPAIHLFGSKNFRIENVR